MAENWNPHRFWNVQIDKCKTTNQKKGPDRPHSLLWTQNQVTVHELECISIYINKYIIHIYIYYTIILRNIPQKYWIFYCPEPLVNQTGPSWPAACAPPYSICCPAGGSLNMVETLSISGTLGTLAVPRNNNGMMYPLAISHIYGKLSVYRWCMILYLLNKRIHVFLQKVLIHMSKNTYNT
jgi:hypothetical protein